MMDRPVPNHFGPFELRRSSRELFKLSKKLKLRLQPFQVLSVLLDHAGEVVTREQLHQQLWPADTFVDFEHGLNTSIKELRAVLDDSAAEPRYIQTLPKLGYRFVYPVTTTVPTAAKEDQPQIPSSKLDGSTGPAIDNAQPKSHVRTLLSVVAVAGILLGFAIVVRRLGHFGPSAGGAASAAIKPRPSIAVLGFKNLSHKPDEEWISTAMAEMLGAELASGQQVRVIPSENVSRIQHDMSLVPSDTYGQETLGKIRNHLGTDMVASGSFLVLPAGPTTKLRIVLQVQDTRTGETVAAITEDGTESDLPELISAGGDSLRHTLGVGSLSASAGREVRASIPGNSEAERLYAQGLAKLQAFDALAARALFERAIAADPGYALSHAALAEAWSQLGYDGNAQAEAKQAVDLSSDLPRENKLSIDGRYRELTHDREGAVDVFRTLHNFFPDNLDYGLRFARAQLRAGHANEALESIAALRKLPAPIGSDPRIDLAEADAAERLGDIRHSQKAAAAAIARAQELGSNLLLASALSAESWAWQNLGQLDKSIEDESQARKLWLASGNSHAAAAALHGLGIRLRDKGDFPAARKSMEDALAEFRRLGAQWDIASCSHNLGMLLTNQSELEPAKAYLEEALAIQRSLSDKRGVASDLDDLGNVLLALGQLPEAEKMKLEALRLFREIGDKRGESITLLNLGEVLYQRGDLAGAKQNFEQSRAIKEQIGFKSGVAYALIDLAAVSTAQDHLDAALALAQQSQAVRSQTSEQVFFAESGIQLSMIALEQGKQADAESLARKAIAIFEQDQAPGSASLAYSVLARSLSAQGKVFEAHAAADRAVSIAQQGSDRMIRLQADLGSAEVDIQSGKAAEATHNLAMLRQQAGRDGYVVYALQARLLLAKAQLKSGQVAAARAGLEKLESDAQAKGFLLIARQSNELLRA